MAATTLTAMRPKGPYLASVAANDLDMNDAAGDAVNGNDVVATNDMLLFAHNTHATNPYNVTITGAADPYGRSQTITNFALQAGEKLLFRLKQAGWADANGKYNVTVENAAVKVAYVDLT